MAIAAETSGAVLNASVFGGFPHADIPHISCSAVIVCDRQADAGTALLDRLLDMAWERRQAFLYEGAPLASQIAHARTLGEGPIVLVDHGDNTASGGTQDVMSVIAEVDAAGPRRRGGRAHLRSGQRGAHPRRGDRGQRDAARSAARSTCRRSTCPGQPLTVTGKVTRITDGEFVVTGPMATGTRVRMGRTAVLDTGRHADRGLGAAQRALRPRRVHPLRHRPAPQALRADQVAPALPRRLRAHRAPHRALRRRRLHQLRPARSSPTGIAGGRSTRSRRLNRRSSRAGSGRQAEQCGPRRPRPSASAAPPPSSGAWPRAPSRAPAPRPSAVRRPSLTSTLPVHDHRVDVAAGARVHERLDRIGVHGPAEMVEVDEQDVGLGRRARGGPDRDGR